MDSEHGRCVAAEAAAAEPPPRRRWRTQGRAGCAEAWECWNNVYARVPSEEPRPSLQVPPRRPSAHLPSRSIRQIHMPIPDPPVGILFVDFLNDFWRKLEVQAHTTMASDPATGRWGGSGLLCMWWNGTEKLTSTAVKQSRGFGGTILYAIGTSAASATINLIEIGFRWQISLLRVMCMLLSSAH